MDSQDTEDEEMSCSSDDESPASSNNSSTSSASTVVRSKSQHQDNTNSDSETDQSGSVMIIDEVGPQAAEASGRQVQDDDKPVAAATDSQTTNDSESNMAPKGKKGKRGGPDSPKKKSKAEKRALLSNPDKILQNVLSKSQFKVANLSQIVEEKFNAPDFQLDISKELKSIVYENTIIKSPHIDKSILPTQFESTHTVNVPTSAITMLQDMYEIPKRRDRFRASQKGRKGKKRKQVDESGSSDRSRIESLSGTPGDSQSMNRAPVQNQAHIQNQGRDNNNRSRGHHRHIYRGRGRGGGFSGFNQSDYYRNQRQHHHSHQTNQRPDATGQRPPKQSERIFYSRPPPDE